MLKDSDIIKAAYFLRENLGIKANEKVNDIESIIGSCGYHFLKNDFSNDFSGFTKYLGGIDYLIGYNTRHNWSSEFKRFTLAHELGHLNLSSHLEILHQKKILISELGYFLDNEIEQEANKFAINFLAPSNSVKKKLQNRLVCFETVTELKEYFEISLEAAAIHMINNSDSACALIVTRNNNVLYDVRSDLFYKNFIHNSIKGNSVNKKTVAYNFSENVSTLKKNNNLKNWYPSLYLNQLVMENTFKIGYGDRIGIFLSIQ